MTLRDGHSRAAESTVALVDAAREILTEIRPATVRAVCYRLFTAKMIASMGQLDTKRVSRILTDARECGEIEWEAIVDETRAPERVASWDNMTAYIRATRNDYRKDHWALQSRRVEVWSEKGTVRGTLAPVLDECGVTFRVMHGFASATAVRDIAEEDKASDKLLTVLYCGDFDPSGMYMSERDLPTRLADYGASTIAVRRIALTAEDVADPDLPSFDLETKGGDSRAKWYLSQFGQRCRELDALSPVILRQRVREAIGDLVDRRVWKRSLLAGQAEAESLRAVLDRWPAA